MDKSHMKTEYVEADNEEEAPAMPYPGNEEIEKNIWEEKQHLDILKHYSEDSLIPKELSSRQWSIFGKGFINTFLEEKDMPMIDINLQLLRIGELSSKPAHLLTQKVVNDLSKMDHYAFIAAKRAIGAKQGTMNERILQNTQISQSISNNEEAMKRKKILGLI